MRAKGEWEGGRRARHRPSAVSKSDLFLSAGSLWQAGRADSGSRIGDWESLVVPFQNTKAATDDVIIYGRGRTRRQTARSRTRTDVQIRDASPPSFFSSTPECISEMMMIKGASHVTYIAFDPRRRRRCLPYIYHSPRTGLGWTELQLSRSRISASMCGRSLS